MTTYMVTWKSITERVPGNREERLKLQMTLLQAVEQSMKAGKLKYFGISPAGDRGFAIMEANENELMAEQVKYSQYIEFEERPFLTADQYMQNLKALVQPIPA